MLTLIQIGSLTVFTLAVANIVKILYKDNNTDDEEDVKGLTKKPRIRR